MMKYKIYNEDVIEWAKRYNKVKFHALLCDPPYHLQSIVKRFGKMSKETNGIVADRIKNRSDGYARLAASGFMGQTWDGGDIAFNPETWALLGEHLYDGAFGMAFAASRNWHRLAVAIEDAGFIIHPTIFCWVQGQGFPKATRIDKKANDERWAGHRYGLQALKPSVEPIIVFQKPYEGRPLDNIIQTGAGTLNIDGTRIPLLTGDDEYVINTFDDGAKPWGDAKGEKYTSRKITTQEGSENGRWPANFILDQETSNRLDKQTGTLTSGKPAGKKHAENMVYGKYKNEDIDVTGFGDSGGASRFFFTVSSKLDESDPVFYCAKASPSEKSAGLGERSNHPTHKPLGLTQWLATLLLPPDHIENRTMMVPFSGAGSEMIGTGLAGWDRCVGIENDTKNGYVDIAHKRLEYWLNELAVQDDRRIKDEE